jgi:hypothetical protein
VTGRDRRVLVLGAVVIATGVLLLRVLPWAVRESLAAEGDLRERAEVLVRARADLADAPALRDSATALARTVVGLAPRLLSGATPAEAAADLSGRLNLAASRNQTKVQQVDQAPDSARAGRLRRVRVRVTLESDIRGVMAFLRAVELGEGALAVTELRIAAPDPGAAGRGPEALRLEAAVTGWFLTPGDGGRGKGEG